MKKFMGILAGALCAAFVMAGDYFPGKIVIPAGTTNDSEDIVLVKSTFGSGKCSLVDRVTCAITDGSGTGLVSFVSLDHGFETALAATAVNMSTSALFENYPRRSYITTENVGYSVVTGNVIVSGTTINVTTNKDLYSVQTIRVKINQPAAADDTEYSFGVFTK